MLLNPYFYLVFSFAFQGRRQQEFLYAHRVGERDFCLFYDPQSSIWLSYMVNGTKEEKFDFTHSVSRAKR
jgi:hypothetical protein